jgi:HAD ATPase, P-type, family IC
VIKNKQSLSGIQGLSQEEVNERAKKGQVNTAVQAPTKTFGEIVRSNSLTYFNFVFLFLATLLFLVRAYKDMSFLPLIFINSLIGILQELRAKQILDKLSVLNTPKIKVVREAKEQEIWTYKLVLDDIIILEAGAQIPADAVVVSGEILVNEALLTGESDEIKKAEDSELMSGSFVVSGKCYAKLTRVGAESYISQLTLKAKAIKTTEQSEILKSLNNFVRLAGILIIPIGLLMFGQQYLIHATPIKMSIQAMIAAIVGMIPEGLFLLSSVTLVLSAVRLAQKKVLVHDMHCIETLARVDVLCVDKTGTITNDKMSVSGIYEMTGSEVKNDLDSDFWRTMMAEEADNDTMKALKKFAEERSVKGTKFEKNSVQQIIGFSSKYKYSGVQFKDKTFLIGAPEFVLKEDLKKYEKTIQKFTKQGYRVLIFGEVTKQKDIELLASGEREISSIKPINIVLLMNEIRESAKRTFKYFAEQGVEVKVISGDNAETVSIVAEKAGIKNAKKFIDLSSLPEGCDFEKIVLENTVFGRVKPEEKRKMVKILQKAGHTVAMTGDGVNDILALKDADCSVAMASGSQAASQVAQLVLLDSDFSRMPQIVDEGRRVVNNLERSGSLFLVKNVFSFITALLSIGFGFMYPLLPTQVSLVTMFTIGVPSFFLAQIPNKDLIRGNFMINILKKAIPAALTNVIIVLALINLRLWLGLTREQLGMLCVLGWEVVGITYLARICMPYDNIWKKLIVSGCTFGMLFCMIFLQSLFSVHINLSMIEWVIFSVILIITVPLMMTIENMSRWLYRNVMIKILKNKIIDKLPEIE